MSTSACVGTPRADFATLPSRITFGSCSDPRRPMPLLDVARGFDPELHLWLGDNIYADTEDPARMEVRYEELSDAVEFAGLAKTAPFLSIWDDHDYGQNDAGRDYPMRARSRAMFLDFWGEPARSKRRKHSGIHASWRFSDGKRTLQVIALDTRYNRDELTVNDGTGLNDYLPTRDTSRTLLGEAQWDWLEDRLDEPADLRILMSSIQVAHEYNGYESWTLFPHERARLVELIADTRAERVIILSGDVHWGEISRLPIPDGYPLYDITSSGINQTWPFIAGNVARVGEPVADHNVGLLTIDWANDRVTASLHDAAGTAKASHAIPFEALTFPQ